MLLHLELVQDLAHPKGHLLGAPQGTVLSVACLGDGSEGGLGRSEEVLAGEEIQWDWFERRQAFWGGVCYVLVGTLPHSGRFRGAIQIPQGSSRLPRAHCPTSPEPTRCSTRRSR